MKSGRWRSVRGAAHTRTVVAVHKAEGVLRDTRQPQGRGYNIKAKGYVPQRRRVRGDLYVVLVGLLESRDYNDSTIEPYRYDNRDIIHLFTLH